MEGRRREANPLRVLCARTMPDEVTESAYGKRKGRTALRQVGL